MSLIRAAECKSPDRGRVPKPAASPQYARPLALRPRLRYWVSAAPFNWCRRHSKERFDDRQSTARTFNHVAVLKGGWSAERDVSLRSGAAVAEALRGEDYTVTEIDVARDSPARLAEVKPEACFNALHGRFGEDGCVQGILECLAIPLPTPACWRPRSPCTKSARKP